MPLGTEVDLGEVHIHKKAIGDIAAVSLKEVPGVRLAHFGFLSDFFEFFGCKNFPGVHVSVDRSGQISLELHIEVEYGLNIPLAAHHIQNKVQEALEDTLNIEVKEINISIQSVDKRPT